MSFRVQKSDFDPEDGFLYYVSFKPNMEIGCEEISARMPIQAVVSLSETSDLADLTFELPKQCRNSQALTFLRTGPGEADVDPRVSIAILGFNGDAVVDVPAKLDLDLAGRIVGMEIQWTPKGEQN